MIKLSRRWRRLLWGLGLSWAVTAPSFASVEKIEILERSPVEAGRSFGAVGAYERITGRLHYSLSPEEAANQPIIDLKLAPKNSEGKVEFSGDFVLLRPVKSEKANGALLYEVDNRGNVFLFNQFNNGPLSNDLTKPEALGDGWLLEQGYTLLWSGWNWDVVPGNNRHQIDLPIARNADGSSLTGKVGYEFVVNAPAKSSSYLGILAKGYPFADNAREGAELTVRDAPNGERTVVPRSEWRFARFEADKIIDDATSIYVEGGLAPGRLYELTYVAKDPKIVGLGLAAIRDALSFFRFEEKDRAGSLNPLAEPGSSLPDRTEVFGISQSGRAIQTILIAGLHVDEKGRSVIDGAFVHVAGGGKGGFNIRFGQTTRHFSPYEERLYSTDYFPFATVDQTDPVTGERGGILARAHQLKAVPKVIYTSSSTDYWARSASLLATDTEGKKDLGLDPNARLYLLAGGQHVVYGAPTRGIYENCINPFDYRPQLRALQVSLDRWVAKKGVPPASAYPRIADGGLVTIKGYKNQFPKLPDLRLPNSYLQPDRFDYGPDFAKKGVIALWPPIPGRPYGTLIPAPDRDGNDKSGIRSVAIELPLGSYLPWNLRNQAAGASEQLARLYGSFIPFAATEEVREANNDPRASLEKRYANVESYVARVQVVAKAQAEKGYLLESDIPRIVESSRSFYERVRDRNPSDASCAYTK
ncbi:hypothetical protein FACS1894205_4850 [Alphaproteobacteria bacterium]|nr:hypothetical protein FACS1894205_4850 [Alphaproteobacteria bacterium]